VNIFAAIQRLEIQARRASEWVRGGRESEDPTHSLARRACIRPASGRMKVFTAVALKGFLMQTSRWFFGRIGSLAFAGSCLCSATLGYAGDWPQILGPIGTARPTVRRCNRGRSRVSRRCGPMNWPRLCRPGGAEGRVVIFHRVGESEQLDALDAKTGRALWRVAFAAAYRGGIDPDTGPRCVPLIHAGCVYVFGAAGDLHSVELASGKQRWSRPTYREYRGNEGTSAPAAARSSWRQVIDQRRRCEDAGIVAFSLADGRTRWTATAEKPATPRLHSRRSTGNNTSFSPHD